MRLSHRDQLRDAEEPAPFDVAFSKESYLFKEYRESDDKLPIVKGIVQSHEVDEAMDETLAIVDALERGATHYTSNLGYLDLRRALARPKGGHDQPRDQPERSAFRHTRQDAR